MKKFLILLEQTGEGCDYTIGCGISYCFLDAENAEEAFKKWAHDNDLDNPEEPGMLEYHGPDGEGEYAQVMVIEVAGGKTNEHLWTQFLDRQLKINAEAEAEEERKRKLAQYEKLKAELGK